MKRILAAALLGAAALAGAGHAGLVPDGLDWRSENRAARDARVARERLTAGLADLEHAFETVAQALDPSVVAVFTTRVLEPPTTPGMPFGPGEEIPPMFDEFLRRFMEPGFPSQPRAEHGLGSGVIVSKDGFIVTNNHVVERANDLRVHLSDGRSMPARVVGTDPRTDLAAIKVDATDLVPASFGDSDAVKVGQWVAAFGSPFGLQRSVTAGIVSAKGRSNLQITDFDDFIQTDAAINRGNSGGALVDLRGQVIGINTAIVSQSGGYQGVGFAIPSNLVRMIMDQLIRQGRVVRGWLGVVIQDLTPQIAESFGLEDGKGVLIADVSEGTPASAAGLRAGDIIVSMDGAPQTEMRAFRNRIARTPPGTEIRLGIWRENQNLEIPVRIGEAEAPEPRGESPVAVREGRSQAAGLGLELRDLTPEIRRRYRIPDDVEGALITSVRPGSPADRAGLTPGSVIQGIAHRPVHTATEAVGEIRHHDLQEGVLLRVRTGELTRFVHVREE